MGKQWNRCDACGRSIAYEDFASGAAVRVLDTPDSAFSAEAFTTLCFDHAGKAYGLPGNGIEPSDA